MKKPVIPVVFAANDNYAIFCYIAIYSMIQKADGHYRSEERRVGKECL